LEASPVRRGDRSELVASQNVHQVHEVLMEKYRKDPLRPIIGQGNYGVVYRVRDVSNGQEYALKCHKCADVIEDTTVRELSCLTALRGHPNIILLLDCFMDEDRVAMLMPYVPFELTKAIHCKPTAPLSFVASFSLQTANALEYMHRQGILHRDLTPSNVLLTADLTVKVGDLGLARQFSKRMSLCVVTEPYRAPELFADGEVGEYTCAVDMWSLGAIILDAKEGMVVFAGTQQYNTLNKVMALASTDLSEERRDALWTSRGFRVLRRATRTQPVCSEASLTAVECRPRIVDPQQSDPRRSPRWSAAPHTGSLNSLRATHCGCGSAPVPKVWTPSLLISGALLASCPWPVVLRFQT
uniref:Protein kinase domain-containing protein n=1 Tax=Oryzias melastigma TaxID=30732 RepID=A0A3B3CDB3_ORYME